jgi:hypothetical protein
MSLLGSPKTRQFVADEHVTKFGWSTGMRPPADQVWPLSDVVYREKSPE